MAEVKNKDVMHQIKSMLESLQEEDPKQVKIILNLLQEVVKEYNSGRSMGIERKLYDMIDGETFETKKKGK
jgi:rubrerythrin